MLAAASLPCVVGTASLPCLAVESPDPGMPVKCLDSMHAQLAAMSRCGYCSRQVLSNREEVGSIRWCYKDRFLQLHRNLPELMERGVAKALKRLVSNAGHDRDTALPAFLAALRDSTGLDKVSTARRAGASTTLAPTWPKGDSTTPAAASWHQRLQHCTASPCTALLPGSEALPVHPRPCSAWQCMQDMRRSCEAKAHASPAHKSAAALASCDWSRCVVQLCGRCPSSSNTIRGMLTLKLLGLQRSST